MTGKQPMQADGGGGPPAKNDGVSKSDAGGRGGTGESGGGASPDRDHAEPDREGAGDFKGGQSERGYTGPGQIAGKKPGTSY